jgi:hypothetical protein
MRSWRLPEQRNRRGIVVNEVVVQTQEHPMVIPRVAVKVPTVQVVSGTHTTLVKVLAHLITELLENLSKSRVMLAVLGTHL